MISINTCVLPQFIVPSFDQQQTMVGPGVPYQVSELAVSINCIQEYELMTLNELMSKYCMCGVPEI